MNTGRLSARRPGARQLDPALRQFSAMLRWRARWMLRKAAPDTATAARLLPVLLQANFAHPLLRKDAPGVRGLRFRHAWVVWAKRFSLAPPQSMQRDAEAVAAVVVLPLGAQLEVLVITQPNLDLVARQRLDARMSALNTVFGVTARELRVRAVDASALTVQERELCIAFGGLVAGECPARLLEAGEPEEFPAVNLALRAPTTLAALAMMMVAGRPLAGAAESFQVLLASGVSARELADPDVACVRWASPYTLRGKMLDAALRWTRPARPKAERPGAFELLAVGRGLAISCAMSVRSLPLALGRPLRERLRREVLAPGLPRILVPLLSPAALKFEAAAAAHGVHTVALADGAVAGQGRTAVQARVRALSLRAQTNAPPLAQSSPVYEIIEARLGRPVERPTLLCVLEHAHVPGPPFDLLNRGPERRMALRSATLVLLRPDRRPTAWRVRPDEVMRKLFEAGLRDQHVEIVAVEPEGAPTAARLQRVALFARPKPRYTPAVEAGGTVWVSRHDRVHKFGLRKFARRPTTVTIEPEANDLSMAPTRGNRPDPGFSAPRVLDCRVFQFKAGLACVLTCDDQGHFLREEVPLPLLEEHLMRGQELLRACHPPAMLAQRLAEPLERPLPELRDLHRVKLTVGGSLPFGLWIKLKEDQIDLGTDGWSMAAEMILSGVPLHSVVRLEVERAEVKAKGELLPPLFQLYARSLVLRRLGAWLARKQAAAMPLAYRSAGR